MRREIFVSAAFLLVLPFGMSRSQVSAYFELENRYTFEGKRVLLRPEVNVYAQRFSNGDVVNPYFYALANNTWGEAYGGLLFHPLSNVFFNSGFGVEANSSPYRANIGATMTIEDWSLAQWYEFGGSGFWYNVSLNRFICKEYSLGIILKRYYGLGLNVWYFLAATPLSVNITPLYDFEASRSRLCAVLRFTF